jgi:hypothetical protein
MLNVGLFTYLRSKYQKGIHSKQEIHDIIYQFKKEQIEEVIEVILYKCLISLPTVITRIN